ncbi:hypothetical protein ACF087_32320 [Streptomyces goshikiensis]|uniref:hypothetical protein n=1 Tax=Streptomyces goshikiensis TaxID=1942 RepID=UPI0036FC0E52
MPRSLSLDRFRRRVQAARPARPARPVCGTKSDNDQWPNAAASWEPGHRWHPTLRETCEERAVAAADQAERDRSEAAAAATAENARG